jgi:transcriptional regulator with XRE-family HTH domain
MTRKSFGEDDFTQSVTLQNVGANLDLIRRLEHLSLAELGKRTGLSDRHLDSLIGMRSNVTVLVLEQIAERLGIPFLTFIGTRLDANIPGGRSGFLDGLRDERALVSPYERQQSPTPVRLASGSPQILPSGLAPDLANLLQISHAVWLYFRFPLSLRMVEEMLAARGIAVSRETVRQWAMKFGQSFANQIRRRLPASGDKWHLDEVDQLI